MNKLGFLIFFTVYAAINFYIFWRGRQALPKDFLFQFIYTALFLLMSSGFFVAVFLEGKIHYLFTAVADNLGGFWMISLLYFLAAVLLADLLRLGNYFFGFFPEKVKTNYELAKLVYFAAVLLLLVILTGIGYVRFSNPKVVNLNLDIAKKAGNIKSLSIVALSDVHLGEVIRKNMLVKYVELINRQNADVILIAGDLFDRNLHSVERQKMDAELRKLKSKYGVYAILGNHEYYGNLGEAMEAIRRSGIKLLRDSAVTIDSSFVIVGRDDKTNPRRISLDSILLKVNNQLPLIMLDHQPLQLSQAAKNNIDLQISGHTHNGQIYPMNKIVARMYELGYGYKKTGDTHYYVSSGLGLWGAPIRLGTQSEIVKIQLNFPE
jgi:predicted MPP superfamily phosphohydrolase